MLRAILKYLSFCLVIITGNAFAQVSSEKAKDSFNSKNYQLTIDEINSINASEIHFDSLLYLKAYSQIKLNKLKDASTSISQLLQINPNYNDAYFLKGLISAIKEKYPDAISHFNKVLDITPNHEKALYNRALAKGLLEDYNEAIKDLDKCLSLNPNYALAFYNRAYWYEILENYDKAIADYNNAIKIDKHYTEAYLALTYAYYQKGDNINACETLNSAKTEGIEIANDLIQNFCK